MKSVKSSDNRYFWLFQCAVLTYFHRLLSDCFDDQGHKNKTHEIRSKFARLYPIPSCVLYCSSHRYYIRISEVYPGLRISLAMMHAINGAPLPARELDEEFTFLVKCSLMIRCFTPAFPAYQSMPDMCENLQEYTPYVTVRSYVI